MNIVLLQNLTTFWGERRGGEGRGGRGEGRKRGRGEEGKGEEKGEGEEGGRAEPEGRRREREEGGVERTGREGREKEKILPFFIINMFGFINELAEYIILPEMEPVNVKNKNSPPSLTVHSAS